MKIRFTWVLWMLLLSMIFVPKAQALAVGNLAPEFELLNSRGENVSLQKMKGHPVLVKLGTTWCPSCRQMTKDISSIEPFLIDQKVKVIDIFLQDTLEDMEQFYTSIGMDIPEYALFDNGSVQRDYQVFAIPRLLLIDARGIIHLDQSFFNQGLIQRQIVELNIK